MIFQINTTTRFFKALVFTVYVNESQSNWYLALWNVISKVCGAIEMLYT